jgi:hypothetical protein
MNDERVAGNLMQRNQRLHETAEIFVLGLGAQLAFSIFLESDHF